jgi:hypothetical protein
MTHTALRIRIPPINEAEFAPTPWTDETDDDDYETYIGCIGCGEEAPPTYWGNFCSRSCYLSWCFAEEEDDEE